jgi:hypothetical protein
MFLDRVILSGADHAVNSAVEEPVLSLSKEPASPSTHHECSNPLGHEAPHSFVIPEGNPLFQHCHTDLSEAEGEESPQFAPPADNRDSQAAILLKGGIHHG